MPESSLPIWTSRPSMSNVRILLLRRRQNRSTGIAVSNSPVAPLSKCRRSIGLTGMLGSTWAVWMRLKMVSGTRA